MSCFIFKLGCALSSKGGPALDAEVNKLRATKPSIKQNEG